MFRQKATRWDIATMAAVLLCAAALALVPRLVTQSSADRLVVTTPDGSLEYRLSEPQRFEVTSRGVTLCIVIEDGAAYVERSSCPDGVCVASRRISQSGETILCAPAGVTLTVKGGDGDVDFVAG